LILSKIIKTVATRYRILKPKCAKFDALDGVSLQKSPDPPLHLGAYF